MSFRFVVLILLAGLLGFTGCTTVPHTGRSALHLVSPEQLAASAAVQFGQIKQQTPISTDPTYNAMVRRVGDRIAYVAAPDLPNADWEFVVFEDDEMVNAFAMPGGKVAVYTGLFEVVQSDDDLAIVIGHEVAHVVAGHSAERVSQQMLAAGGALALQIGTSDSDMSDDQRRLLLGAYGAGASLGFMLPYSRLHEAEADEIGLIYSAKAGYDPRAAFGFWQRMAATSPGAPPEFLSTHPAAETRMRRIRVMMPRMMNIYRNR
jgi:predicted Zn-dependent protease